MKRILFMVAALLVGAPAYGQQAGQAAKPFVVEPQYPVGGGEVTITYDPALTSLAGSEQIAGVIYISDGARWTVDDLDLGRQGDALKATYTLPVNSVLFVCKFFGDDGKADFGASTMSSYGMFVYSTDENGNPMRKPMQWVQRSLLFSRSLDKYAVPNFLPDEMKIDDAETERVMKQELLQFPQSAAAMVCYLYTLQNKLHPGEFHDMLRGDIDAMLAQELTPEQSLLQLMELSRTVLGDEAKTKQIEQTILDRYPDGLSVRDGEMRKVFNEQDNGRQLEMLAKFVERFPPQNHTVPQTMADEIFYPRLYWTVIRNAPQSEWYGLLEKYLPGMTYQDVHETYYRAIFLPFDKEILTAKELRPLAELVYGELEKRMNGTEDRYYAQSRQARYSPQQWRAEMLRNGGNADARLTHARILMETGSPKPALEILRQVAGGRSANFNDTYAELLTLNGEDNIAFIEENVRRGAVSEELIGTLRKAYKGGDFDAYLNGLRSEEHVARMEARLLSQLIDVPVETFRLESARGGMVDTNELKGKIIVLDFWATWCGPCLAAMPGMKMATERYKDNPNVAFYFVDTMERSKDYKEYVPQVMAQRGFGDLEVLYDGVNERGNQATTFGVYGKQFNMSGIPLKMIIDGRGHARWVSTGGTSNALELADEVSFLIDHLLDESK